MRKIFSKLKDYSVLLLLGISILTVVAGVSVYNYLKRKASLSSQKSQNNFNPLYKTEPLNEQG